MSDPIGELAAALARAQTAFRPVKRDRTVTVQTKSGGSYTFSYAPLDTVIEATRQALADNGLAVVQILDDGALETRLLHSSGASVAGRIDLPQTTSIQDMGSAITYLRRYAMQAVLGIAAEEDDDGNRADGNIAAPAGRRARAESPHAAPQQPAKAAERREPINGQSVWEGRPVAGPGAPFDALYREAEDGPAFGFHLLVDRPGRDPQKVRVMCRGPLALAASAAWPADGPSSVWGSGELVHWDASKAPYTEVRATRLITPGWTVPATDAKTAPDDEDLSQLPF